MQAISQDAINMVARFQKDYNNENKEQPALFHMDEMVQIILDQNG